MSSAKRGALRANMKNPIFVKTADGKVSVTEKIAETLSTGPVAMFRKIFDESFGKLRRSEVIAKAVEAGISKNTAATYYQKLKTAS
jgi:hypothetical protein